MFRDQGDFDLRNNTGSSAVGCDINGDSDTTTDSEADLALTLMTTVMDDNVSEGDVSVIKASRRMFL